ncbi:MAG: hypothetical protein K2P58_00200 [Hyphomonadaceae bacterium]|nr:hypothetical protein [Hyphomonadaceae bacterium]
MTNDITLAALLGEAPKTPDPGFRIDVLARVALKRKRRAAAIRGLKLIAAFTGVGLIAPLAGAFGMTAADVQPLLASAGAIVAGYLVALLATQGPAATLARSRALLRL